MSLVVLGSGCSSFLPFPAVPLLAAPRFPWRARSRAAPGQGGEILSVVGSKFRGFDQKGNLLHQARFFQENFPVVEDFACWRISLAACRSRMNSEISLLTELD